MSHSKIFAVIRVMIVLSLIMSLAIDYGDAGSRRRFVQKRSIHEKKHHVAFEEKPEEYEKWIADWKKKDNAKAYYG